MAKNMPPYPAPTMPMTEKPLCPAKQNFIVYNPHKPKKPRQKKQRNCSLTCKQQENETFLQLPPCIIEDSSYIENLNE